MKLGKFTKFSELTSNLGFFLPNELDFCQINEDIQGGVIINLLKTVVFLGYFRTSPVMPLFHLLLPGHRANPQA